MNDFVAIGDIVVDAFIKLKDASVNCDMNREHCTITLAFGDKIPYESVEEVFAVGNAPNAAVTAARLGLSSTLISNLGNDEHGHNCIESLKKDGVSIEFVTVHPKEKTNYHYVLWYENDRTILVKHEHYQYKFPDIVAPKWIYLSSLGEKTLTHHQEIASYLKNHPDIFLAFQPGTFQIKFGKDELRNIYVRSKIFFCNVEEAEKILELNTLGTEELLKRMHALGPEIVVITDGPKGAYAFDGENMWHQSPYPDLKPPFERTGAGDAFASTTVAALALGKNLPTALSWGAINSMSVVQQVGAQKGLLTRLQIEKYLKNAPTSFQTKKI